MEVLITQEVRRHFQRRGVDELDVQRAFVQPHSTFPVRQGIKRIVTDMHDRRLNVTFEQREDGRICVKAAWWST